MKLFDVTEVIEDELRKFPFQCSSPDWSKRYTVLFRTRRTHRYFRAEGVHVPHIKSVTIPGFKKIKVLGYK